VTLFSYLGLLRSHCLRSPWCFPLGFSQQVVSKPLVYGGTSEGRLWLRYSCLKMLPLEGECINMVEEGLTLEGEIVRYSSVSRSPTLGRNEKVEQHIRKKTHKPNALRFWVKGGVILLYGFTQFSLFEISPVFPSWILPTQLFWFYSVEIP